MTLESLLTRLRAGDREAFDEIASAQGERLRSVARRVLGCGETGAEVVQEVLFRLWRDRETLEIREHLSGYLARAVRNRALDHLKRRRVEERWREREMLEVSDLHVEGPGGQPSDRSEFARPLSEALERLPPRRREAVLLRWRDGLSYQEIAARLEISVKTVENQIGRGLKTLREELGRSWDR